VVEKWIKLHSRESQLTFYKTLTLEAASKPFVRSFVPLLPEPYRSNGDNER